MIKRWMVSDPGRKIAQVSVYFVAVSVFEPGVLIFSSIYLYSAFSLLGKR